MNVSCSKNEEIENCCFSLSVQEQFTILNQRGDDLLNPNTSNYYPLDKMKLYYLINNEKIEVFDANMAYPRNIKLIDETNPYRLGIFTYNGEEGLISEVNGVKIGKSVALLELREGVTDTIITEWKSIDNKYFANGKVWYNGVLHEPATVPFEVRK